MFPLHALLFRLRVIMLYPSFIACCTALQKQILFQLHELQFFYLMPHIDNPSFSGQAFEGPIVHRLLSSTTACT